MAELMTGRLRLVMAVRPWEGRRGPATKEPIPKAAAEAEGAKFQGHQFPKGVIWRGVSSFRAIVAKNLGEFRAFLFQSLSLGRELCGGTDVE